MEKPKKWVVRIFVGHRIVNKFVVYGDNEEEAKRVALLHVSHHPNLWQEDFKWDMKLFKRKIRKVS